MRKRSLLFLIAFLIFTLTPHARSGGDGGAPSLAIKWINAMMNQGAGLNNIITPDFQYSNYPFTGRIYKGRRGDIPFFAKAAKPAEINIEEVKGGYGGQIVKLNSVAETGLYREWETILFITQGGISKVTEIAREGTFEGYPEGCPETAFKRDIVVTLSGTPSIYGGTKTIKLYSLSISTDSLDYADADVEEKVLKNCKPYPDTSLIQEEVLVFDENGQIEHASIMANKSKDRGSKIAVGAVYLREDGINFPGRLFQIGSGKDGLLLTFTTERGSGGKINPAILYEWSGSGWRPIWNFTVGFGSSKGVLAGEAGEVTWSLKSAVGAAGEPQIIARLESAYSKGFDCQAGTTIIFNKSGSTFKPVKGGVPPSCLKMPSVSAASLKGSGKGFTLPERKGAAYEEEEED